MSGNIFEGWKASDYPTEAIKQLDKITDFLKSSTEDMVNHPSHYTSGSIECIDAMIETQGSDWYLNKYVELRDGISEEIFGEEK